MMRAVLAGGLSLLFIICTCAIGCCGEGGGSTASERVGKVGEETVKDAELWKLEAERAERGEQDRKRNLLFSLYTGVQYDDNITLESMGVDAPPQDRTDWKLVQALRAEYRAINTEEHIVGLRYDFYQSFVDINDELQLTGHTVTAYHTLARSPHVFYTPASFSRYNLFWHRYLDIYSVKPTLFVEQSAQAVGVIRFEWSHLNYYGLPDNDFDENDRDSNVYSLTGEEWFVFGDRAQHRLEIAYTMRREIADRQEWSSTSHKVRLGGGSQLPWWQLSVGSFVAYEGKDYSKRNPVFGRIQEEDVMTYGLSVSRPLWRDASATLSYQFTDNESNITSQDYEKSQVTLGVTVRF
jgi:hypothetical protein